MFGWLMAWALSCYASSLVFRFRPRLSSKLAQYLPTTQIRVHSLPNTCVSTCLTRGDGLFSLVIGQTCTHFCPFRADLLEIIGLSCSSLDCDLEPTYIPN